MRVLAIDDNPGILMLLTDILSDMGAQVTEATDCKMAWDIIESESPFEVVLIDWMTPHMSGLELLKLIRNNDRYKDVILLMVTGLTEVDEVSQALQAGANEYLMKPFTKEMLEDKLRLCGVHFDNPDASHSTSEGAL